MYENVLITGLVLRAPREAGVKDEKRYVEPPKVTVWGVNENLMQRVWSVAVVRVVVENRPDVVLFADTLHLAVAAARKPGDRELCPLEALQHAVLVRDYERAEGIEHTMRMALEPLAEALSAAPKTDAEFDAMEAAVEELAAAVVGHVVKVDFAKRDRWLNVRRHALHLIRSPQDGATTFAGKPVDELLREFAENTTQRGAEVRETANEERAMAALADYYDDGDLEATADVEPPRWVSEFF